MLTISWIQPGCVCVTALPKLLRHSQLPFPFVYSWTTPHPNRYAENATRLVLFTCPTRAVRNMAYLVLLGAQYSAPRHSNVARLIGPRRFNNTCLLYTSPSP